jgi:glucose/arabinose dehydrogenase
VKIVVSLGADRRILLAVVAGLLAGFLPLLLLLLHGKPATAVTLRSGFEDRLVTSVNRPIALDFTPDGRMLIVNQQGRVRVYKDGQLLQTPAVDLSGRICANKERGLLSVAVDPDFGTAGHNHVYLYYTFNKFGVCPVDDPPNPNNPVNRVSRFVMSGDRIDPSSEVVLLDNMPSPDGNHNGGDLSFGKDGHLYLSAGDGQCDYAGDSGCAPQNDAARDPHVLLGKILRITRDGKIPATNPYQGTDSARCNLTGSTDPGKQCQETFASGLRNPFRFAFDPDASGTRFFIGDVGTQSWEEVDEGKSGADYAWNFCEGNHDNPGRPGSVDCGSAPYTPPIHEYNHAATGCSAITGAAFVPNGSWPAEYDDSYLYGDYVCNKIFELTPHEGGGFTQTEFASGLGQAGPIDMAFGPHEGGQALYYTTFGNNGEVHRISYTAGNRAPHAVLSATPIYGDVPLEVNLDGSGSSDPDADDTLTTYVWDFGDGSPTETTATPATSHTYSTDGTYTASLTVRDNHGAEDTATVRIDAGNAPPEPTIVSPAQAELFAVGERIVLHGSATDPQDGQLPDAALSWEVERHHNNDHTHPFLPPTSGNDVEITAPPPEDLDSTHPAGNYLEIRLTATDSEGLSKTVSHRLNPKAVDVTFQTLPNSKLELRINGATVTAPETLTSWEGYGLNAEAPSPQTLAGTTYEFASWSDGGARSHVVVTRSEPSTYTATYTATSAACTITGTSAGETLTGTPGDDVICGLDGSDTIKGLAGNDVIRGASGNDKLFGGAGDDALYGATGTDTANFSGSSAAITASLTDNSATGEGSDTLASVEDLVGSPSNDTLTGSAANNSLTGGDGADKLTGSGGNDTARGGVGNDSVVGSNGADTLYGDSGDDTVNSRDGVSGNDSLHGGSHVNGDTAVADATEKSIIGFP